MALDYGHTCPDIDRGINEFKSDIEGYLSDMLDYCCPMLEGEQKETFIKDYATRMYDDFEPNFEKVRSSNEDMRKEADRQIARFEDEIEDLRAIVKEKDDQINDLESENRELLKELSEQIK